MSRRPLRVPATQLWSKCVRALQRSARRANTREKAPCSGRPTVAAAAALLAIRISSPQVIRGEVSLARGGDGGHNTTSAAISAGRCPGARRSEGDASGRKDDRSSFLGRSPMRLFLSFCTPRSRTLRYAAPCGFLSGAPSSARFALGARVFENRTFTRAGAPWRIGIQI